MSFRFSVVIIIASKQANIKIAFTLMNSIFIIIDQHLVFSVLLLLLLRRCRMFQPEHIYVNNLKFIVNNRHVAWI